jgi:hypothetical protein
MIDVSTVTNLGILGANLLLISFIYRQVRHVYRPVLTTKVISRNQSVNSVPGVLKPGILYLSISNISNNLASNLRIRYDLSLENKKIIEENRVLKYLNPGEATKEPINLGKIIENHPELFNENQIENVTKIIPKKTLKLLLDVVVTHGFPKHEIKDSYEIEWGSLESYPNFEDHPVVFCWNRRNGMYIYKIGEKLAG